MDYIATVGGTNYTFLGNTDIHFYSDGKNADGTLSNDDLQGKFGSIERPLITTPTSLLQVLATANVVGNSYTLSGGNLLYFWSDGVVSNGY